MIRVAATGVLLTALLGCSGSPGQRAEAPVLVFAAASATDAMLAVGAAFEAETGVAVSVSTASSAILARQIEAGAGASIFLSANRDWVDYLDAKGLVRARRDLLRNGLVLIVPADSDTALIGVEGLASVDVEQVALADPRSAPAGKYAAAALREAGVWEAVRTKVIPAGDVRQALLYVEYGEADAGIVYATDAMASNRVRVVAELDEWLEEPVTYRLALLRGDEADTQARRLYDFLLSPKAIAIFERLGFTAIGFE